MQNKKYWEQRAENNLIQGEVKAQEQINRIEKLWSDIVEETENEVIRFYRRYAEGEKKELASVLKMLDEEETKGLKEQAQKFYKKAKEKGWQDTYINKVLSLSSSFKKRFERIEVLKLILANIIQGLFEEEQKEFTYNLTELYKESYRRYMFETQKGLNVGVSFEVPDRKVIEKIIKTKWVGNNYSNRIWIEKEKLIMSLEQELSKGFSMGENPKKIAKRLQEKLLVSKHNTERLARTEFNHITNEASFDSIKELNKKLGGGLFNKYRFLATLDKRTSKDCQELDLKEFTFEEKQEGVNFPPVHPNCRSTYVIVFDDEEIEKRISKRLDDGTVEYIPSNINYKEWSKRFDKSK